MKIRVPSISLLLLSFFLIALLIQSVILWTWGGIVDVRINLFLQLGLLISYAYWSYATYRNHLNAPFLFIASIWFWHSSFLTGHFYGLSPLFEYVGNKFTYGEDCVPQATALVGLSMAFAALGTLAVRLRGDGGETRGGMLNCLSPRSGAISRLILWLFCALVAIKYWVDGPNSDMDYLSSYLYTSGSLSYRIFQSVKFLAVPVILLGVSSAKNLSNMLVVSAGVATLVFFSLLDGSRSMPFIYSWAFIIGLNAFWKKIPLWVLMGLGVIFSGLSFVFDQIRVVAIGFNMFNLSNLDQNVDFLHIFWNSGGTILAVIRTISFLGGTGFWLGKSFLASIVYLLPRPIIDGVGLSMFDSLPPSEWLILNSPDVPVGGGLGYSLVAESYLNFGVFGVLIFAGIGWFISNNYVRFSKSSNLYGALHSFNVVSILLLHMRNDSGSYLRALVFGFVLIELMRFVDKSSSESEKVNHPRL